MLPREKKREDRRPRLPTDMVILDVASLAFDDEVVPVDALAEPVPEFVEVHLQVWVVHDIVAIPQHLKDGPTDPPEHDCVFGKLRCHPSFVTRFLLPAGLSIHLPPPLLQPLMMRSYRWVHKCARVAGGSSESVIEGL